ncbi:hypothetical protein C8E86_6047 [Catellatospora citrea]|nr:hypothetical protein C8E86_6047 [Catellatospora citrea]
MIVGTHRTCVRRPSRRATDAHYDLDWGIRTSRNRHEAPSTRRSCTCGRWGAFRLVERCREHDSRSKVAVGRLGVVRPRARRETRCVQSLEDEFQAACEDAIGTCHDLSPLVQSAARRAMIDRQGAAEAARRLVVSGTIRAGFERLVRAGRPGLNIECAVATRVADPCSVRAFVRPHHGVVGRGRLTALRSASPIGGRSNGGRSATPPPDRAYASEVDRRASRRIRAVGEPVTWADAPSWRGHGPRVQQRARTDGQPIRR